MTDPLQPLLPGWTTGRSVIPPPKVWELEKNILTLPVNIARQILSKSNPVPTLGTAFMSMLLLRPVLGSPATRPLLSPSSKGLGKRHRKPPVLAMSVSSHSLTPFLESCL